MTSPKNDGLAARRFAIAVIEDAVKRRLPLDDRLDALSADAAYAALSPSDRGLTRAIAMSALRRLGTIRNALAERMERGMPPASGKLEFALIAGAAQILVLGTPAHAAVNTTVTLLREDKHGQHFADLANAVLRRISAEKTEIDAAADPLKTDTPQWLANRWIDAFGSDEATRIAQAHNSEPSVDITVKSDPEGWAERLGAIVLPTGSLRLTSRTAIQQLPGFADGEWWVQDAAAAIPARLLAAAPSERVLDLCAAPGGKTAQLALTAGRVMAVDRSEQRMRRLKDNMARLGLTVDTEVAEAAAFRSDRFDAVLLDAPCSATGTIRRHPDVAWSKTYEDVLKLSGVQRRLLDHAATLVRPGGRLVYATCSLEHAEGETQIVDFLLRHPEFSRSPVRVDEVGGLAELINSQGDLRCLPSHLPHSVDRLAGLDGFFASRLVRAAD